MKKENGYGLQATGYRNKNATVGWCLAVACRLSPVACL